MKEIWQKNLKLMTTMKTMMVRQFSIMNITSVPLNFVVNTVVKFLFDKRFELICIKLFVWQITFQSTYSNLPDFQVKPSTSKASWYVPKHKKRKKNESAIAEFEEQTKQDLDRNESKNKGTTFSD